MLLGLRSAGRRSFFWRRLPRVCYVSSYPPRECGIATFTEDLIREFDRLETFARSRVIAVNEQGESFNYPDLVRFELEKEELETYQRAAEYVNDHGFAVSCLQHEFGLWGGTWGEHILHYLEGLKVPNVTTFHTVLGRKRVVESGYPEEKIWQIVRGIGEMSEEVVVMTEKSRGILAEEYGIPVRKVRVIGHGVPTFDAAYASRAKARLRLSDRLVLMTFGLLHRGKGIEYALQAIPQVVAQEPRLLYLVVGETHPEVRKREGESYRNSLEIAIQDLGLGDYVRFYNRFLTKRELKLYLQAADIYLAPYLDESQSSSGTLSYAMAAGKPVIATPFAHASEALDEGRGIMCRFRDPYSIAEGIVRLLDRETREEMGRRAYEYAAGMSWGAVATKYAEVFKKCIG